jgi:hypothetical protein
MPVSPETGSFAAAIDENLANAEKVAAGLSKEQFNWRADPGVWSIGQCFAHLNITDGFDLVTLESLIADARARVLTGNGPFRYGFLSTKFAQSQDLPVKRKASAPKVFQPPPDVNPEEAVAEYRRIAKGVRRLVLSSDGLDLARIKVTLGALPAPLRAIFKMPLGARFLLLTNHNRRHVWQAGEVRKHPSFPKV